MRYCLLDLFRLFFAFVIVLGHIMGFQHSPFPAGGLVVDFFFILSSFVLTCYIIDTRIEYKDFIIARISRIFPLFWLSFVLMIAIKQIKPYTGSMLGRTLTEVLLLHQIGLTEQLPSLGINHPSWSLSVEFWLNIGMLFFLVQYLQQRFSRRTFSSMMVFLGFMVVFGLTILIRLKTDFEHAHKQNFLYFTNLGVLRCSIDFIIGILVYYLSKSRLSLIKNKTVYKLTVYEVLLCIILIGCLIKKGSVGYKLLSLLVFSMIICITTQVNCGYITQLARLPIINQLGHMSYGVYLFHMPIHEFCKRYTSFYLSMSSGEQAAVVCLLSFLISVPIYYLYEKKMKLTFSKKLYSLIS